MKRDVAWRRAWARGVSALIATAMVLSWRAASGAPGDIFTTAAPAIGDAAPAATSIADGESGVSTNTGAYTYTYPIPEPPGRFGMQPHISLSYSSQGSIYGGLAAGWSISGLPIITEDTSRGRLWSSTFTVPVKQYQSSMAGGRPLVVVNEPHATDMSPYRAQNDSSFDRYLRVTNPALGYSWKALSPSGTVTYFGHTDHASTCTILSDGYAPITRVEDPFGNQVDFYYEAGVDGECRIARIYWGQNPNAQIGPFAGMLFTYANPTPTCGGVPTGSQTSYRTGTKIVTGASRLDKIETVAVAPSSWSGTGTAPPPVTPPDHHRTITLAYSSEAAACDPENGLNGHAPYRALTSIKEAAARGSETPIEIPQIDFTYGDAGVVYGASQQTTVPWVTGVVPKNNLGWGYRPDDAWPTVEAMMIDLDGDGRIDRLESQPVVDPTTGKTTRCEAHWYRNGGDGLFADAGPIEIPTLKWAGATTDPEFVGGATAGVNVVTGTHERCALNYQRTAYQNSFEGLTAECPPYDSVSCPNQVRPPPNALGWCPSTQSDCGDHKENPTGDTYFAWRWMDMNGDQLPDLVGSPVTGGIASYDLRQGNRQNAPIEPAIFGAFPACPSTPYTAEPDPLSWANAPYTMCGGMFPWFVYLNHGTDIVSGQRIFGQARPGGGGTTLDTWGPVPDRILYQPVPLETANGDSSLTSRPVGQYAGTVDLDGDGFADAVHRGPGTSAPSWDVFRNDGTGQFLPGLGSSPLTFGTGTGTNFFISRTNYTASANPNPIGAEGLEDFNGDGLVDHWVETADPNTADVHLNDGRQFRTTDGLTAGRPGTDGVPVPGSVSTAGAAKNYYVCRGIREDLRHATDLDADGRSDLIVYGNPLQWEMAPQFNVGGQFVGSPTILDAVARHGMLLEQFVGGYPDYDCPSTSTKTWATGADYVDLDGDGLKEEVSFGSPNTMYVGTRTYAGPPRLLVSIKNNRGATTTISYSSLNGAAVVQDPATNQASPATNWVVQSVSTHDNYAGTTSATTYAYAYPHWAPEGDTTIPHPYAFRGFESVESTGPSGAVTVERFSYDPDWSGRLVTKIVKPSAASAVHSIDDTTWEPRSLFGGNVTTYHATKSDHWTCKNGQDEAACRANLDTRTHTETTWSALPSVTPLLWQATSTRLGTGPTLADGDRETATTYDLTADESTYRLRPLETTKNERVSGSWQTYGKSASTWDATHGAQLTSEVWVDSDPANRAISRSVYDFTTGNVVERWKPEQNAANTVKTTLAYDSRKLFVATETNELGHVRDYTWEYGTGTKVQTDGPTIRSCITGPSCPADASHPYKEQFKTDIDALGRVLARWQVAGNGYLYVLYKVETTTYVEATTTTPAMVTRRRRIDPGDNPNPRFTQEDTELDGHGRPLRMISHVFGTAPTDAITTYEYAADGTLTAVSVPDPTANDSSTVTYAYGYDSLGRPTSIRRPDSSNPAERSGVDIAYDGLSQTTTEVVKLNDGLPASTKTTHDVFGRLASVDEQSEASSWQSTLYTYGPDDLVRTITDPEGVITALTHDWAGRRTRITRPGGTSDVACVALVGTSGCRSWKYTYDRNGNEVSEQAPGSPNPPLTDAAYTTTTAYDALDRPTSRLIAPRALSASDQALFGSRETFVWEGPGVQKGRLRTWNMYGPTGLGIVGLSFSPYAEGVPWLTGYGFAGAGFATISRDVVEEGWSPLGPWRTVRHRESLGNQTDGQTWTSTQVDARGLPVRLQVIDARAQTTYYAVAEQTRNVAGLVTKRRTNVPTSLGAVGYVESNWTYDTLGRVVDQTVMKGPSAAPTQVVRQSLAYFGNDDPKTLIHSLGTSARTFAFGYDHRHQLTSAVADDASYFTSAYAYGDAGRLATVAVAQTMTPAPAGSELKPRDVTYLYDGDDPEQVTAVVQTSGPNQGATIAAYAYDAAGNQITRSDPATGESWDFVYDGKDQLRRATKKHNGVVQGSEEYWYDNEGTRTQVLKRDAAGTKTELVFFIKDTEFHYDGAGILQKSYAHASLGTPVARIERPGVGQGYGPAVFEYQFHGLASNTIAAVAPDGTINASFSYSPFGEVLEATDGGGSSGAGTAAHKRRFNDKIEDDLTGLKYYGARYYDPLSMTWTQSDPLYRFAPDAAWSAPRRAFLYTSGLSNPLRYIDPDGRDVILVGSAQPPELGLDHVQILRAASRSGSFTTMSNTRKSTTSVTGIAQMKRALAGKSDKKVAYFGHGVLDAREIAPDGSTGVTPAQLAEAIKGMRRLPTDVYLYGCDTEDTGFAKELSELVPGVTVHGYAGELDVDATAPVDVNGRPNKNRAVLNPRNPSAETSHTSDPRQERHNLPADADGNGTVTDEEESDLMRRWSQ